MSAKTSTSLKQALSYRAVEILLADNCGFLKVSGADLALVPEDQIIQKKKYKEFTDKAEEFEQMKKQWQGLTDKLSNALAHKTKEYVDLVETMQKFESMPTQHFEQIVLVMLTRMYVCVGCI